MALTAALALVAWAAAWGWADLRALGPRQAMAGWERQGYVDDGYDWEGAVTRVESARGLNPVSADYVMELARLYEWRAFQQRLTPELAQAHRVRAMTYYQEALRLRPSWGAAWAELAQSRVLSDKGMDETLAALERATVFGPWDSEVHRRVIWIGISRWERLPDGARRQVRQVIQRALEIDTTLQAPYFIDVFIVETAVHYGWHDQLRGLLTKPAHLKLLDERLQQQRNRGAG